MGACDFCGRNEDLPFRCRYCGGKFCAAHHLPESHNCPNVSGWHASCRAGAEEVPQSPPACTRCGAAGPEVRYCPHCGNACCPAHLPPEYHDCPALSVTPAPPPQPAGPAPAPRTGKRARSLSVFSIVLVAAAVAVVVFGGLLYAGYLSATGTASQAHPEPTAVISVQQPAGTVPATIPATGTGAVPSVTASPLPLKMPATFSVTPVPTTVAGIVSYPRIVSDPARGTITRNYTFPFQDRSVTITGSVETAVYNGAKNGEKAAVMNREGIDRSAWGPGYFRAFVNDERQEALYASLIASFRQVRAETGLSDDEYLELMAVFVQSLEYDTEGAEDIENGNRFPVETFVDGKGVCGDKSMLLAGLLSREGYDAVLFVFDPEKHMAVGIRSGDASYRGTGYAYIETTRLSFAGTEPDELRGGTTLASTPYVVPVGNGWKGYSAIAQTRYIESEQDEAEARIRALEAELKTTASDSTQYNRIVEEHNRYVTLFNYIGTHGYDRPGTFAFVVAHAITPPGDAVAAAAASAEPEYAACDSGAASSCPSGSHCCVADNTCYAWCTNGVWEPDYCACRV